MYIKKKTPKEEQEENEVSWETLILELEWRFRTRFPGPGEKWTVLKMKKRALAANGMNNCWLFYPGRVLHQSAGQQEKMKCHIITI